MSFALDLAHVKTEDAALLLASDLDRILGKLFRADPALLLGRGAGRWEVVDVANRDTLMFFTHDAETAVRFMEAFVARNPGSSMDAEVLHSWRVAQDALSERDGEAGVPVAGALEARNSRGGTRPEASDISVRSENVYPLFTSRSTRRHERPPLPRQLHDRTAR